MIKPEQNERRSTLRGKRVIVLGGTSGMGFATAEAAADEGASVVVVSSRQEKVDAAVSRLPQGAEGHAVDLANETQVRDFFGRIGEFDHLVFTAGDPLQLATLGEVDMDAARQMFNLRYWGALMAAKYGSVNIRSGGSITLASGTAGVRPQKGCTVAGSVCGAVEALTKALAVELSPLRVNAVRFGLMRTEMWSGIPEGDRNAMYKAAEKFLPVGRVGEPEDAAEAFLYLMREKYSTGQTIVVDGGATLV
ncbi:SDR family oxidoreductase [Paenibacillus oleatilyticus]|uniref:SDR family oxidoreductase n=1 Tax=Paenibacillus oleatilyticus TaxID=2594886 RepID=UPI001C1F8A0B|nr:SDR family oxidoreductase [Paenibacillus oleatilyticus]MBU7318175.1 SDR family oxidoreductase [Paenibacillus oleatilyticus]